MGTKACGSLPAGVQICLGHLLEWQDSHPSERALLVPRAPAGSRESYNMGNPRRTEPLVLSPVHLWNSLLHLRRGAGRQLAPQILPRVWVMRGWY